MNYSKLFICLFIGLASFPFAQDDYQFLIKIHYSTPAEFNTLQQLGLDIWEAKPGEILVYACQNDLDNLTKNNISYTTIYHSNQEILSATYAQSTDTTPFHTYDELSVALYDLSTAYPTLCRLSTLGQSWENRQIYIMKISDNPQLNESEPDICFIANQHAREWITEEVALGFIQYLLQNYATDAYVKDLVDRSQIWIIPLANPDGKEYTHSSTTNRLWRKNRRNNGGGVYGVDLNRNFPYQFGLLSGTSKSSTSDVYCGPYAFSEPENIAFRDFILSRISTMKLIFNIHSYGQHILYPWGYTYSTLSNPYLTNYQNLGNGIASQMSTYRNTHYTSGQWSVLLGYTGSGVTEDWAWHDLGIYCLGSELTPQNDPPGFIIPSSEIVPTTYDFIPGGLYAIDWGLQFTPIPDWMLY